MSVSAVGSGDAGGVALAASKQELLGKEDFLNLLVAQLKNQDPLNPMEGTEFTAQLAQFSSLEQLRNIYGGIGNLQDGQEALNRTEALAYIGKAAKIADDAVSIAGGEAEPIRFRLDADAAAAVVSITDAAGNPVRIFDRESLSEGDHVIDWDGKNGQGKPLDDGAYRVEVAAFDTENEQVTATPYTVAPISGMSAGTGEAVLLAGNRRITVGDILEVTTP